jgi:hypothetical protein
LRRNTLVALVLALAFAAQAYGNPSLHGTWSAAEVNGRPLLVTFDANGAGKINGQPMRWQTLGPMLAIEQNGDVATYSFQIDGGKLKVSGGDLSGVATLTRGSKAADAAKAKQPSKPAGQARQAASGTSQELVGKWCNLAQFTANNRGGSSRMECFELKPDGTYAYHYEGSMSANAPGMYGGTASQSADAGRWSYNGSELTAHSRNGTVSTYTLEKRNHPRNKRDPMICLNGTCYVTYYNKPAW